MTFSGRFLRYNDRSVFTLKETYISESEKEENEISEKNKIFSTQEEKIKSMEIESKGTISILINKVGCIFPIVISSKFRMAV